MGNRNSFLEAISLQVGTVIGAGILGLPYIIAKAGLLNGLLLIVILGLAVLALNLIIGEIALRTKGNHQLVGYAHKYLGNKGRKLMTIVMTLFIYGALTAYIVGVGDSMNALLPWSSLFYSVLFFIVASLIIFFGLKAVANSEIFFVTLFLFIILLISAFSVPHVNAVNLTEFSFNKFLLPYGVILFALLGSVSIPEMKEELGRDNKKLKKAIIIGTFIPIIVYLIFAFVVVGVTGSNTTEIATIGLGLLLGEEMLFFGNVFAVFAMATSFLSLGLALKEMYNYDYKINKNLSWLLTCFPPIVVFLLGLRNFINILSLSGAILGGLEAVVLVFIYMKVKKMSERKPEYSLAFNKPLVYALLILFFGGIIYAILNI